MPIYWIPSSHLTERSRPSPLAANVRSVSCICRNVTLGMECWKPQSALCAVRSVRLLNSKLIVYSGNDQTVARKLIYNPGHDPIKHLDQVWSGNKRSSDFVGLMSNIETGGEQTHPLLLLKVRKEVLNTLLSILNNAINDVCLYFEQCKL